MNSPSEHMQVVEMQVPPVGHEQHTAPMPSSKHLPALDGLRAIAVLSVFLGHYGGGRQSSTAVLRFVGLLCHWGWQGVTLFFLLSGFLITGLLWDSKGQEHWFRNFYIRRALRILPLYYGTLVLLLICPLFDRDLSFERVARVVAVHALYLQNVPYFNAYWKQVPIPFWLDHYWSLAVEEQFYLLWPLLLYRAKSLRQAMILCLGTFALSGLFSVVNQFAAADSAAFAQSLPAHAGELALGGAFALAYRTTYWNEVRRASQWAAAFAAAVLVAGIDFLRAPMAVAIFVSVLQLLFSIALGGVLTSMLNPGPMQRLGSLRCLRWLGKISFGVYIFHLLFLLAYGRLAQAITGRATHDNLFYATRFLVAAVLTLVVAWLSFEFYEKPFLRLKARFAPQQT